MVLEGHFLILFSIKITDNQIKKPIIMKKSMIRKFFLLVVFSLATLSCGSTGSVDYANMYKNVDTENYSVMDLLRMKDDLSTFASLADAANLDWTTEFSEGFTIFAPTNEAFEKLSVNKYKELLLPESRAKAVQFVKRHVLPQKVWSNEFNDSQAIETSVDEEISVSTRGNGNIITVGGATIVKPDIEASDGVIHVVNSVVQPTSDVFTD
ncbi:MAG: fasciclin domain-containing protein [Gillisia sp.]